MNVQDLVHNIEIIDDQSVIEHLHFKYNKSLHSASILLFSLILGSSDHHQRIESYVGSWGNTLIPPIRYLPSDVPILTSKMEKVQHLYNTT
jgi:hypothetical protein